MERLAWTLAVTTLKPVSAVYSQEMQRMVVFPLPQERRSVINWLDAQSAVTNYSLLSLSTEIGQQAGAGIGGTVDNGNEMERTA